MIDKLKHNHRQPEDYYFFFAIQTFFTIENNKTILEIKQDTCEKWEQGPLVFRFLETESSLPKYFYLPDGEYSFCSREGGSQSKHRIVKNLKEPDEIKLHELLGEFHFSYWFKPNYIFGYTFSFLGLLTSALNPVYTFTEGHKDELASSFYQLQEMACAVAANADVRDKVRKCFGDQSSIKLETAAESARKGYASAIDSVYREVIFPEIATINKPEGGKQMNDSFVSNIGIVYILRPFIDKIEFVLDYINTGEWSKESTSDEDGDLAEKQGWEEILRKYHQLAMNYISEHQIEQQTEQQKKNFLTAVKSLSTGEPISETEKLVVLGAELAEKLEKNPSISVAKALHSRRMNKICKDSGIDYDTIKKTR